MTTTKADSIWSQTFALLCLAQLLSYAHNALLTPTLPLYVTHLGGSPCVVGLVLAAFAVTSVFLRPLSGYWTDTWSAAGVMTSGCFIMGASLLLFFIPIPETLMLGNGLRGIGWAGLNTGGYVVLALTAPVMRRGEASGYYTGVQGTVSILFPAVALWLIDAPLGGLRVVMGLSGALTVAAGFIGLVLGRSVPSAASDHLESPGRVQLNPFALVEREVLLAAAFLLGLNLTHPAVSEFLVLYARSIGIENVAWYFVISGSTSLLARPTLGRISDRIGVGPSLVAGFALEILGLLLLPVASGLALVIVSGIFYMLGSAIGSTTTLALAMKRANPQRRGRAMATFSIAYPLGAGVGALLIGGGVEIAGYFWMYLMAAGLGVAGLFITLTNWSGLKDN